MKKVISALTVAAMCASMSASVLPAFAIDAASTEFYLKVVSADKGTISADGTTITFASAADAKGANLTIQEFIKADTAAPYVQQITTGFRVVNTNAIALGESGANYTKGSGEKKSYTFGDATVVTNKFVNCFGFAEEDEDEDSGYAFNTNTVSYSWGHSKNWQWEYTGPDTLNMIWSQPAGAQFNDAQTDKYPFTEFYATIGDDIADGSYEIEILDTWENKNLPAGEQTLDGNTINDGDKVAKVTKVSGLKIVVGNAEVTPTTEAPTTEAPTTEAPTTEAPTAAPTTEAPTAAPTTEAPTAAPTTQPSQDPTQPAVNKADASEWTWYFDDVTYDPAKDEKKSGVTIKAYVTKDEGTYGYEFTPEINGKSIADAGFKVTSCKQLDDGYAFGTFDYNKDNGHVGGASNETADSKLADGTAVVSLKLLPPADAAPGTVYEVSFKGLKVGNFAEEAKFPKAVSGSITIAGGTTDPTQPTTAEPTAEPTTQAPTAEPTTQPSQDPTQPAANKADASEWTWYFDDVTYDPAKDEKKSGVTIKAYVTKDEGTYGYEFTPEIDGKSIADAGFKVTSCKQLDDGYAFGTFDYNKDNGHVGGASNETADSKLADGTAVVSLKLLPPADAAPGTVYVVSFKGLKVGNFAEEAKFPKAVSGSITIAGGTTDPTQPTTAEPTAEPTTDATSEVPTTPTEPGSYLYGDVNEDGKVELVDVVKLNRFICGIDAELSDKAMEQANCYRTTDAGSGSTKADLDGSDSVEILKFLIGVVTSLPTKK